MKKKFIFLGLATLMLGVTFPAHAQVDFGLGAGVNYNRYLGDMKKEDFKISRDYFSYLVSARMEFLGFLGAEAIFDYYPGQDDIDYSMTPKATATLGLIGNIIQVGAGINKTYTKIKLSGGGSEGEWSDLSYHLKAGVQIPLGDIWLNADAYYFVDQFKYDKIVKDFDEDMITFGARVHYHF